MDAIFRKVLRNMAPEKNSATNTNRETKFITKKATKIRPQETKRHFIMLLKLIVPK